MEMVEKGETGSEDSLSREVGIIEMLKKKLCLRSSNLEK